MGGQLSSLCALSGSRRLSVFLTVVFVFIWTINSIPLSLSTWNYLLLLPPRRRDDTRAFYITTAVVWFWCQVEFRRRSSAYSCCVREALFQFQRVSVVVQRFNPVILLGGFYPALAHWRAIYTVSRKKRCHWFFCCNFYKYWWIFIIFRAQLR